jgi:hypothetical protein
MLSGLPRRAHSPGRKPRSAPVAEARRIGLPESLPAAPESSVPVLHALSSHPPGQRTAPHVATAIRSLQRALGNQSVQRLLTQASTPQSPQGPIQRALTPEKLVTGERTRLRGTLRNGEVSEAWSPAGTRLTDTSSFSVDWDRTDSTGLWVWAEQGQQTGWLRIAKIRRAGDVAGRVHASTEVAAIYTSVAFLQGKLSRDELVSRVRLLDDAEFEEAFISARKPKPGETADDVLKAARACEGFALNMKSGARQALVRRSAETAVVLHESLHLVANNKVQTDAGSLADEGFTEYLRMHSVQDPDDAMYLPVKSNYRKGFDAVEALSRLVSFQDIQDAYFNGNVSAIRNAINGQIDQRLLNQRVRDAESWAADLKPEVDKAKQYTLTAYELWCALMKMEKTQPAASLLQGDISPDSTRGVLGPPTLFTPSADLFPAAPP